MGKVSTEQLSRLLSSLGERARSSKKPDLTPALGLVSDVGRLIIRGEESDVRATQAAVGALRERLRGEDAKNTPAKALESMNSHAYLAGAMWALNEVMNARLATIEVQRQQSYHETRKNRVTRMVSAVLTKDKSISPSDLLESTLDDGTKARRDELSRVLGTMIDRGWVHVVSAAPGADGRKKFFALTPAGKSALARRGSREIGERAAKLVSVELPKKAPAKKAPTKKATAKKATAKKATAKKAFAKKSTQK
jgi:hypothetical protein